MTTVEKTQTKSAPGFSANVPHDSRYYTEMVSYEYSILRYLHDPMAGEALNFGVVVYSRETGYLSFMIHSGTARLSCAFPAFDADQHKRVVSRFELALKQQINQIVQATAPNSLHLLDIPESLEFILSGIWNESGLAYETTPPSAGTSDDMEDTLSALYNRFVGSHLEHKSRTRRDDDDLWTRTYREALRDHHVTEHLEPQVIKVEGFEFNFPHTFKNGKYHILQPVSLDYKDTEGIRDRLVRLVGQASTLKQAEEPNKLYLLLGKPQDIDMNISYRKAVITLRRSLGDSCEIYEEEQAELLSEEIAGIMKRAGVLPQKQHI